MAPPKGFKHTEEAKQKISKTLSLHNMTPEHREKIRLGKIGKSFSKSANNFSAEHPTTKDIAWAAGIYEGEGHISRCGKYSCAMFVSQKDTWILERLKNLFGGTIRTDNNRTSPISQWVIYGVRARGFAYTIFSFLSPRRRAQLRLYLETL